MLSRSGSNSGDQQQKRSWCNRQTRVKQQQHTHRRVIRRLVKGEETERKIKRQSFLPFRRSRRLSREMLVHQPHQFSPRFLLFHSKKKRKRKIKKSYRNDTHSLCQQVFSLFLFLRGTRSFYFYGNVNLQYHELIKSFLTPSIFF